MYTKIAKIISILSFCSFAIIGCSSDKNGANNLAPLKPVNSVDINKYLGKWYEIARYPNRFERNCEYVTAQYSLINDGSGAVRVLNTCIKDGNKDKPKTARGVAKPLKGSNNAVLAVNFAPFPLPQGDGNYHILYLDNDYKFALIGEPSRKYLWLLSRAPTISEDEKKPLLEAATQNGYDTSKLEYVKQ